MSLTVCLLCSAPIKCKLILLEQRLWQIQNANTIPTLTHAAVALQLNYGKKSPPTPLPDLLLHLCFCCRFLADAAA